MEHADSMDPREEAPGEAEGGAGRAAAPPSTDAGSAAAAAHAEPTVSKPTAGIQRLTDSVVRRLFLWLFPRWIRPNHLTVLRFILTPVVLVLLHYDLRWWALGVFVVAISTDFIDGAMARTRDQITPVGTVIDPIADKLLVASVLAWAGWDYLVVKLILIFIALELILTAVGIWVSLPGRRARPANVFGKAKMVVQSVALVLFLLASFLGFDGLQTVALYMLWLAILLAALSGAKHVLGVSSAYRSRTRGLGEGETSGGGSAGS